MSPRLSPVLSRLDLPLAELHAARLDGELVAVDDCFSPIDEPDDTLHRARSLAMTSPRRLIAERDSAAWVLGARDRPPSRHQFCADATARTSASAASRHQFREVVIDETEILSIGGLRLTTPIRTVIDIARSSSRFTASERASAAILMNRGGFGAAECLAIMNRRRNLPGKQRALARLRDAERLGVQPSLTLYTS